MKTTDLVLCQHEPVCHEHEREWFAGGELYHEIERYWYCEKCKELLPDPQEQEDEIPF